MICDETSGYCPAKAKNRRCNDDSDGGLEVRDDGTHGETEDELREEYHARDDAHVGADAAGDGIRLITLVLVSLVEIVVVLREKYSGRFQPFALCS